MNNREAASKIKDVKLRSKIQALTESKLTQKLENMSAIDVEELLNEIFRKPIAGDIDLTWEILDLYFMISWIKAFELIIKHHDSLNILEVASGDVTVVPRAEDTFSEGNGTYVTANLNKELTQNFLYKIKNLRIGIKVVEDNAENLGSYYKADAFDIIAFQHAVNDIIQTIVAGKVGIDTANSNWWDIMPAMIQAVSKYYEDNKLYDIASTEFIYLISVCCSLLRDGGYMIFNHTMYKVDLDLGYNHELYRSYIQLAREWISKSGLPLVEVTFNEFDPQWWLFLKKLN